MKQNEILFSLLPGWFFILKGYYVKGIIYFTAFSLTIWLILFEKINLPFPPFIIIILVWLITVIDSIILYQEYNFRIETEQLIRIVMHNNKKLNIALPFYFVKFWNALKTINIKPDYFRETVKRLSNYELPNDWKNFIHYYKNVYIQY